MQKNEFLIKHRKTLLVAAVLLLIAALLATVYLTFAPQPAQGEKRISVAVVHGDGTQKDFTLLTTKDTLREALDELGLVSGDESPMGLFIHTVDGERADSAKQEWWCVSMGGEMLNTGIDSTPLPADGSFELTLVTGY